MKSFMDVEKQLVILDLIEEVPNFNAFVDGCLCSGNDAFINASQMHSNATQMQNNSRSTKIVTDGQ
jgi:pyruvate-formate lyase-activating enzyme